MADTLLIIEDEERLRTELERHFRGAGWQVLIASSVAEARKALQDEAHPLVALADMSLPDGNALDLLEQTRDGEPVCEWILLTGFGSVSDSVRALRLGAFEFLEKPCEMERIDLAAAGAARSARAQRRLRDQAQARSLRYAPEAFVGRSEAAGAVREMLSKLMGVPYSALVITGETGTGKGLVARILHHWGPRCDGPLIEVNCAALPRDLLESELFGHEAGAFTGAKGRHRGFMEQADGGTLFLDEISEMDLDLQAKLLKSIEDRSVRRLGGEREIGVDVQILVASNTDLDRQVDSGEFRSDLFHRLSVFRLDLPTLRERPEDLQDLVPLLVAEFNATAGKRVKVIPEQVYDRLHGHDWPGNVRELRNVVERCVLFADGELFPLRWLQLSENGRPPGSPGVEGDRLLIPLDGSMALDEMDRYIIKTALERNGHNVTATARALGTTRETLRYRIQKYALGAAAAAEQA